MRTLRYSIYYYLTKFFYLATGLLILSGSYYYATSTNIAIEDKIYTINGKVTLFPLWTQFVEYLVFFFLLSALFIFLLTVYYMLHKKQKSKKYKQYAHLYTTRLLLLVLTERKINKIKIKEEINELKKSIKSDFCKELILTTLVKIHSQTTGIVHQNTEIVLHTFHYENFILSYLRSPYYRHKKFALTLIAEFQLSGYERYIFKFSEKSKNQQIHAQALLTLTQLDTYTNLLELIKMQTNLSMWDINIILRNIKQNKSTNIPYRDLLAAKTEGLLLLGIYLVKMNERENCKEIIKKITKHENNRIKEESIITFSLFCKEEEDFIFLKENYISASKKAKKTIIKRVTKWNNKTEVINLLKWIAENDTLENKLESLSQLMTIDLSQVIGLIKSKDPLVRHACEQIVDINI